MILSFRSHFPPYLLDESAGTPTLFQESIKVALEPSLRSEGSMPKLHTIRRGHRWKAGDTIHFTADNRTPQACQFAVAPCTGTQEIVMDLGDQPTRQLQLLVSIDQRHTRSFDVERLARNDRLTLEQFTRWFTMDILQHGVFRGQIIHWTDLRY